ncbi:hypothetical protein OG232_04855 [Streptomyces sp. NBC_01411]|uniref:hypothetical protein n=1 Tax=Streptomyces sp. NBC_01411 TaxID=2903857 RepID=UPI003251B798
MKRTAQQRARRSGLAEARNGGLDAPRGMTRVGVVLYACLTAGEEPAGTLATLRAYAAARDWSIAAEVIHQSAPGDDTGARDVWPRVAELIEGRLAQGIVTTAHLPGERLIAWLAQHHAFAVSTDGTDQTPATA